MRNRSIVPRSTPLGPAVLGLLLLLPASAAAEPPTSTGWNQWRGPGRDGQVAGSHWPDDLAAMERLWRVELGKGYASPIVAGERVFVAETVGGKAEAVRALSRADGSELWQVSWPARGRVPFFAAANGDWIRATPLHDGDALYVGGMEEVLVKLDAATGQELWRVDFPARFGTRVPDFGFVSSPLVDGDHLFVQAANSLVKLDKATGETVWRALQNDGNMMRSGAFSSPVMATLAGRRQLVVQTRERLNGLDPTTGEALWSQPVPSFRGMNILTPTIHQDRILTSTYRNNTFLFAIADGPEGLEPRLLWTHKSPGYMSSPVIVDGHAYLHLGSGRLICIDLETGSERWVSEPFGKYWSMIAQGDKILGLNDLGELVLLAADPERLQILDRRPVADSSTYAHLAALGDELIVRDLDGITAYRWTAGRATPEPTTAAPAAAATTAP
jgi:outer membrane protein assembly factor BamB